MKKGNNRMIILFILYVVLASSGLILFKIGNTNANFHITLLNFKIDFSISMIIGILCYGFSFLLWLFIVSKMNLTLAMPLSVALVNTLVVIESLIILKEKISFIQGIGIITIIAGVIIITSQK